MLFFQESSLKRTEDAELFYFLRMAHKQRKAMEESKVALQRTLTLSPSGAFAKEVQKVLAEHEK